MRDQLLRIAQVLLILSAVLAPASSSAQLSRDSDVFKAIEAKDGLLFELGFNQCNMQEIKNILPEKFDFYHDKDGKISSRDEFIKSLQSDLCKTGKNRFQRKLDTESMQVFALYDNGDLYGAIQVGVHRFGGVTARFTNLWLKKNHKWIPSVIMSYDHTLDKTEKISDVIFINITENEMKRYLGDYQFSPEFVLSVILSEGKLYGEAQGQRIELLAYDDLRFLDQNQVTRLDFSIDSKGEIDGLKMTGPNGEMHARKILL